MGPQLDEKTTDYIKKIYKKDKALLKSILDERITASLPEWVR
jgi:hypothetical protein